MKLLGDPGWRHNDFHYNSSVANSYEYLEEKALRRRPGLRYHYHRTIRDYVDYLRKTFPNLPEDLCESYVDLYERAVFSQIKFSTQEYEIFEQVIGKMVELLNEKSNVNKK